MNCNLLISVHPVIGRDIHDMIIPPNPAPTPGPYFWLQILSGLFMPSVKMGIKTQCSNFMVMQRGTDIGPMIVHVGNPVNINLPFIILGSSSKSEFGAHSTLVENKPAAVAFPCPILNINLNCQGPVSPPCPLPTGSVLAFNTASVGFSLGDFVASGLAMVFDMCVGALMNKIGGKIGGKVCPNPGVGIAGPNYIAMMGFNEFRNANAIGALLGTVFNFASGSNSTGATVIDDHTVLGATGNGVDDAFSGLSSFIDAPDPPPDPQPAASSNDSSGGTAPGGVPSSDTPDGGVPHS